MLDFSRNLIGNEYLVELLIKRFNNKKLPNSIIISGDKGIGKATFIFYIVNKILNSFDDSKSFESNTHLLYNNSHPNIRYIKKSFDEKTGLEKNNISIDQIRNLENFLYQSTFNSLPTFIIIDSADDLNTNSANNLLKNLEEPKKNTYFILVAHQFSNLLPTIRSRCINFNFEKPNLEKFKNIISLVSQDADKLDIDFLYNFSNASPGLALDINSEKISYLYKNLLEIFINGKFLYSDILNLSDFVSKFDNYNFKIFLTLLRFIIITIQKIDLGCKIEYELSLSSASKLLNINELILLEILDYLNNNEKDLFIYNLDKKFFCLNIFNPLMQK